MLSLIYIDFWQQYNYGNWRTSHSSSVLQMICGLARAFSLYILGSRLINSQVAWWDVDRQ